MDLSHVSNVAKNGNRVFRHKKRSERAAFSMGKSSKLLVLQHSFLKFFINS